MDITDKTILVKTKPISGKIILKDNVGAYQTQLAALRGKITSDTLVPDAQKAMDLLDASQEFGTTRDWMTFFSSFKVYGITSVANLTTLHAANKAKGSRGQASQRALEKLDEKFEVMKRACTIIMKEYNGDLRALDYGVVVRTEQYKNVVASWSTDFNLAFPIGKADMYSKLAFSALDYQVMKPLVLGRIQMFISFYADLMEGGWLVKVTPNTPYLGDNLRTSAWVISEPEIEGCIEELKIPRDGNEIDQQKKTFETMLLTDFVTADPKPSPWVELLASGVFDVRRLKQSPDFKKADRAGKTKIETEVASFMLSVMNVMKPQGDKWKTAMVDLDKDSPFTKEYFLCFGMLSTTHNQMIKALFPRPNAKGVNIKLKASNLDGNVFGDVKFPAIQNVGIKASEDLAAKPTGRIAARKIANK